MSDLAVPDRYFGFDLDGIGITSDAIGAAVEAARALARGDLMALGLCGQPGIGKSTIAAAIAAASGEASWISVPLVLSALKREMGKPERPVTDGLAEVQAAGGLIVLDDLGAERPTEWARETLFGIVAGAYDEGRPIVFTSCRHPAELAELGHGMLLRRVAADGLILWLGSAVPYTEAAR
jgi:DNA replication protein DnaC